MAVPRVKGGYQKPVLLAWVFPICNCAHAAFPSKSWTVRNTAIPISFAGIGCTKNEPGCIFASTSQEPPRQSGTMGVQERVDQPGSKALLPAAKTLARSEQLEAETRLDIAVED
jgi:hypothetical protein